MTLNLALEDGGLINTAKKGIEEHDKASQKEKEELTGAAGMIQNLIDGLGSTGGTTPVTPPTEDDRALVTTVISTDHEDNKEVKDSLGNPLVIPSGFKYVTGDNVEDGIVIEDANQNQFVWIPVSNIDGNNNASDNPDDENLIKLKSGDKVEITLGRYTFATSSPGTPELKQNGANHSERSASTLISSWFYEDTSSGGRPNGGEGAKNLAGFVKSVQDNHGYYLARYEAGEGNDGKPVSKLGKVWNNITQPDASDAAQKMYEGEEKYTSDLVNSYAWDTAIVYIQAMGNDNYANTNRGTNSSLKSTGETGDVKCNIYDMAGNVGEWTTEYSTRTGTGYNPCVSRGGFCFDSYSYTASRNIDGGGTTGSRTYLGFRPLLYLK